jgi:hypothetical protein
MRRIRGISNRNSNRESIIIMNIGVAFYRLMIKGEGRILM